MTLSLALAARATMLDGFQTFMSVGAGTPTLTVYQGNTSLCVFNLSSPSFGSGNNDALVLSGVPISNTGTSVAGTANRFVIVNENAATALSGMVSVVGGGGDLTAPSVSVTASTTQKLNALVLRLSSLGLLTLEGSLTLV